MPYVDGYVIPVPKANREAYRKIAEMAAPIFKEHGALNVVECWGDDIHEGDGSFTTAVKTAPDETVVFSWVTWPSRAARDAGNAMVMADPRMQTPPDGMPFDSKRMIFGGFEVLLEK